MTTPPDDVERAREQADNALARAKEFRSEGETLATGWRRSRLDNNFRKMIRELATRSE